MMRLPRPRFRPNLEALEERWCPATRPISDFLDAQGHSSAFPNGINTGGPAGLPDALGFSTSTATLEDGTGRWARVDYTGQDAAFLHLNLGTTTTGTINERVLPDGTAEDTVNLVTRNALAWANKFDFVTNPVIFGYLPSQLAANPSLRPAVADSVLQVVVRIPHAGAALPDLVGLNTGTFPPDDTLVSLSFRATGRGTIPAGQDATLVISQTGVLGRTPNPVRDGGFTAEVVDVQVHGKSGGAAAPAVALDAPLSKSSNSAAASAAGAQPTDPAYGAVLTLLVSETTGGGANRKG